MPRYRVTVEDRGQRKTFEVTAASAADARRQVTKRNPPEVTDRALRYRANATPPPGPKTCAFCGGSQNVEVGHVDGFEENTEPHNLIWNCRSCNTIMGHVFKQNGMGRRTRQYNPAKLTEGAKTMPQWVTAVMVMRGKSNVMNLEDAVQMIHDTPETRRSKFAKIIYETAKRRGNRPGRRADDEVPF